MRPVGWRAWYDNGVVYDSRTTQWRDLPTDGLQVVVLYMDEEHSPGRPYRQIIMGMDYVWPSGNDYTGKEGSQPAGVNPGILKRGRWMSDSAYADVVTAALASEGW